MVILKFFNVLPPLFFDAVILAYPARIDNAPPGFGHFQSKE
jgi:hypothetical protein